MPRRTSARWFSYSICAWAWAVGSVAPGVEALEQRGEVIETGFEVGVRDGGRPKSDGPAGAALLSERDTFVAAEVAV